MHFIDVLVHLIGKVIFFLHIFNHQSQPSYGQLSYHPWHVSYFDALLQNLCGRFGQRIAINKINPLFGVIDRMPC